MLWRFVREFPVDTQRLGARRVASVFVGVSFGVGAVLFTINAIGWFGDSTSPAWLMALFELFDRDDPEGAYWLLVTTIAAPAVPFLLWKTRLEAYDDRRRVMLFVGALGVGLTPFVLAVVAAPFVPLLGDPVVQQRAGVFLYAALASIVPITAYSVTVDRVMDLQFLIRSHAAVRPGAVRRMGRQPRSARLRGVRHPGEPTLDHRRVSRTLSTRRTPRAFRGGCARPGIAAASAARHRPLVSGRAIRPVTDPRPPRAAIPNGGEPAWRDQRARRGAELGAARKVDGGIACQRRRDGAGAGGRNDSPDPARFGAARDSSLDSGRRSARLSCADVDRATAAARRSGMAERR